MDYCVQMLFQPIAQFVLCENKNGESVFVFHKSSNTKTMTILANFVYLLSH